MWTHDCEHGQIRGFKVVVVDPSSLSSKAGNDNDNNNYEITDVNVKLDESMTYVEFGPEQLVARVSVSWSSDDEMNGLLTVPLPSTLKNK